MVLGIPDFGLREDVELELLTFWAILPLRSHVLSKDLFRAILPKGCTFVFFGFFEMTDVVPVVKKCMFGHCHRDLTWLYRMI